jgi:hypothetical protein
VRDRGGWTLGEALDRFARPGARRMAFRGASAREAVALEAKVAELRYGCCPTPPASCTRTRQPHAQPRVVPPRGRSGGARVRAR